jgi:hypothetical protein
MRTKTNKVTRKLSRGNVPKPTKRPATVYARADGKATISDDSILLGSRIYSGPKSSVAVSEKLESVTSFQNSERSSFIVFSKFKILVDRIPLTPRISPLNMRSVPAERPTSTRRPNEKS